MIDLIRTYNSQFAFEPEIVNEHKVRKNFKHVVLCGMGGSHLPAGILKILRPGIDIYVHRDYDLPPFDKAFLESGLLIASSYSGNTAEAVSFYKKARQLFDLPVLCITMGGELLRLAQEHNDPYILLPQTAFVPRTALGLTTLALAFALRDRDLYAEIKGVSLDLAALEAKAEGIARQLEGKTPVFYSSQANLSLAYNWKIKCNETAKMHAFMNVFPEANHNELEGYEYPEGSPVVPVLLRDDADDARIVKRFDVFAQILAEKGVAHISILSESDKLAQKIFESIVLGDFVTAMLARQRGVPATDVALIESFKGRIV